MASASGSMWKEPYFVGQQVIYFPCENDPPPTEKEQDETFLKAFEYARTEWQHQFYYAQFQALHSISFNISRYIAENWDSCSERQQTLCNEWREEVETIFESLEEKLANYDHVRDKAYAAYYRTLDADRKKVLKKFPVVYSINVMLSREHQEIQAYFDIMREARHRASKNITKEDFEVFKAKPGRSYYVGSPYLTEELAPKVEIEALKIQCANITNPTFIFKMVSPAMRKEVFKDTRDADGVKIEGLPWEAHQEFLNNIDIFNLFNRDMSLKFPVGSLTEEDILNGLNAKINIRFTAVYQDCSKIDEKSKEWRKKITTISDWLKTKLAKDPRSALYGSANKNPRDGPAAKHLEEIGYTKKLAVMEWREWSGFTQAERIKVREAVFREDLDGQLKAELDKYFGRALIQENEGEEDIENYDENEGDGDNRDSQEDENDVPFEGTGDTTEDEDIYLDDQDPRY